MGQLSTLIWLNTQLHEQFFLSSPVETDHSTRLLALACVWFWCGHRPGRVCHRLPVQSSAAELGQLVLRSPVSVAFDDLWLLLLRRIAVFYSAPVADQIGFGIRRRTDSRLRVVHIYGGFVVSLSSISMTSRERGSIKRAGGKSGFAFVFHSVHSWSALPQHERYALLLPG